MSLIDRIQAEQAVEQAKSELRRGNKEQARRLAQTAIRLYAELEDPWLILAAISEPEASVEFLHKALAINPASEKAQKGLQWALQRLNQQTQANVPAPGQSREQLENTQPIRVRRLALEDASPVNPAGHLAAFLRPSPGIGGMEQHLPRPQMGDRTVPSKVKSRPVEKPSKSVQAKPKKKNRVAWVLIFSVLLVGLCVIAAAYFGLPGWIAKANNSSSLQRPQDALFKPSLTPTPTATFTPTPTPTSTPTVTPTETPVPTDTPTMQPTATQRPMLPYESTYEVPNPGVGEDERWIDVDLSDQMVYAYQGSSVVNSFLVSTGTYLHPTVTGQYRIYVKYYSTTMSGPGYYLTNVPYTMYFYYGYSFHGTYWHHNFGTPMSHGCINMYTPDAEWLFNWASIGTLVNVHY